MAAVESTGTSNRMKEQSETHEKFVGGVFFVPPRKGKIKAMKNEKDEERNRNGNRGRRKCKYKRI